MCANNFLPLKRMNLNFSFKLYISFTNIYGENDLCDTLCYVHQKKNPPPFFSVLNDKPPQQYFTVFGESYSRCPPP